MNQLIKTLTICLFIVFPFGQLTRIPILPSTVNLYFHDLIISLILFLWLLTKPKIKSKLLKPLGIFILTCLLSLVLAFPNFTSQEILTSSLYLVRFTVYSSLIFIFQDLKPKLPLKKLLLLSSALLAVIGLAQYIFLPDTRFLSLLNWDDHYFRVIATFGDPAYVGLILLLSLILAVYTKASIWFYPLYLIPLLLTYSRSTYLALLVALVAYTVFKKKFKLLFLGLLFLSVLPFLPRPGGEGVKLERLFSINQRLENYQDSFSIINQKPVFGIGFNTLRFYQDNPISHAGAGLDSSLLFILATTGIIGLLAFLNFLKVIYHQSILIKVSLIAILTHSLFQNSLFYPWVLIWLFTLTTLKLRE